jgi:hypothetical protein
MSWLAVKLEKPRRQKEAVEVIERFSGLVVYDYQFTGHVGEFFDADAEPPGPPWLRNVLGKDSLSDVGLVIVFDAEFTDHDLHHLKRLPSLGGVWLVETQVTPEGVKKLQEALPECAIMY